MTFCAAICAVPVAVQKSQFRHLSTVVLRMSDNLHTSVRPEMDVAVDSLHGHL